MNGPRAETLFRLGGLVACVIVALPTLARVSFGDVAQYLSEAGVRDLSRVNLGAARWLLAIAQLAFVSVFAVAFWLNTRESTLDAPRRSAVVLLVVEALIACGAADYLFVVAAQAPFVFRPRAALQWLAFQLGLFTAAVALALVRSAAPIVIPEAAMLPQPAGLLVSVIYVAGWQVFAFSLGYLAAAETRTRRDLERGTRELVATQQMLAESSRVAERAQIFRELHDTVGHNLAVLSVNLELASHLTNGRAGDAIAKAQTVARVLLADVRDVLHSRAVERPIDLLGALTTLAAGSHAPAVHLAVPPGLAVADPSVSHAVFRCVQEAITNAVRHAHARNLWIELIEQDRALHVRIRDDGQGAADVRPGGGLEGMRERVELVGGALRLDAAPGRGFTIDVTVPLPEPAQ
jgi:signal transduction histidine kinase